MRPSKGESVFKEVNDRNGRLGGVVVEGFPRSREYSVVRIAKVKSTEI